jgi:hypothetical protein
MTRFWRAPAPGAIATGLIAATGISLSAGAIPAQAANPVGYGISIAAASPAYPGAVLGKVDGHALVVYKVSYHHLNAAVISGTVTGAAAGDRITLLAEPFGAGAFTPGKSEALSPSGGVASYSFAVKPTLATRYKVRVTTGTTADGTSAAQTVFVTRLAVEAGATTCSAGRCEMRGKIFAVVPPRTYRREAGKRWYIYFALASKGRAEPPGILPLDTGAVVGKARRLTKSAFTVPVKIRFDSKLAHAGRHTVWVACTKDTVTKDGLGLPGHHGCGSADIRSHAAYVG